MKCKQCGAIVSPQQLGQIKYIGDKLAEKVSKVVGREVRFPNG